MSVQYYVKLTTDIATYGYRLCSILFHHEYKRKLKPLEDRPKLVTRVRHQNSGTVNKRTLLLDKGESNQLLQGYRGLVLVISGCHTS